MIEKQRIEEIRNKLKNCNFTISSEKIITNNVAKRLEMDTCRRQLLIKKEGARNSKKTFESFAGTKGTKRFESFRNGKFEYISFVLQKKQWREINLNKAGMFKQLSDVS